MAVEKDCLSFHLLKFNLNRVLQQAITEAKFGANGQVAKHRSSQGSA